MYMVKIFVVRSFIFFGLYLGLALTAFLPSAICQSDLPIGTWKSHLSYKEGRKLTQSKNNVIFAAEKGLFTINKEDFSVSFISREQELSDINITDIDYDQNNEQLFITYQDNTFDVLVGSDVINVPFIKTNTSIPGSRTINSFQISGSTTGYFATDFGILGFKLKELEFSFTCFTPLVIHMVQEFNNYIFASTPSGLYFIPSSGANLADFNQWKLLGPENGLPQNTAATDITIFNGSMYVLAGNIVYQIDEDLGFSPAFIRNDPAEKINFISGEGSSLMIGLEKNDVSRILFVNPSGIIKESPLRCISKATWALEDQNGRVWYGDAWAPVKYTDPGNLIDCKSLVFEVPYTNEASSVRFRKNKAYVASGGVTEDYQYKFTRYGFYTLEDGSWKNYNQDNIALIGQTDFLNLFCLAPHPVTSDIYLGSYYNGIIQYNEETGESRHWNKDNSILRGVVGDEARTRIAGLAFDKNKNLWISNFGAPKPLVVKTEDNAWYSFSVPQSNNLAEIAIDDLGNKWVVATGTGSGIAVFNEGSNIGSASDDKVRFISRNNSEITGNKVNCIAVDLDGEVWVGTDRGPVVFDCGDPFAESCRGNTRKVIVEGIPALLLRDEDILSIEVDGANRKWFGTRNGIFVQSPDGQDEVYRFDTKISPLLDNKVIDLAYNNLSGEMMIVTAAGIQSYKTETLGGDRKHKSEVYAYPNPVRPDYSGPIAIKGLSRDARVKITDVNGKMIYETQALGGQAIWDGNNYNGVRAATGVYLVFSASEDTSFEPDSFVTKILIIR
jgi:hypothetical protein